MSGESSPPSLKLRRVGSVEQGAGSREQGAEGKKWGAQGSERRAQGTGQKVSSERGEINIIF